MKLIENQFINLHTRLEKREGLTYFLGFFSLVLVLCFSACRDDLLVPDNSQTQPAGNGLTLINLPGVMSVSLSNPVDEATRASQTIEGKPLDDGLAAEYELASPSEEDKAKGEYYHYLLLFKNSSSHPLIFPLDDSWTQTPDRTDPYNNLTLTLSKVYMNGIDGELNGNTESENFSSIPALKSYLDGMEAYVLLNFKLDDAACNYSKSDGSLISGTGLGNTVKKLASLTKSEFESLLMYDYKITANKKTITGEGTIWTPTNFFTMSSSVYSNGSAMVHDGNFDSSKIFNTEEEAKASPCLVAWVERLTSKVTVSFDDLPKMNFSKFDSYGDQYIKSISIDPATGLPVIELSVERVNMQSGKGGITFSDTTGYHINHTPIDATVKIVGFGVSNTEPSTRLIKDINYSLSISGWQWNDPANHRSYWARDSHYGVERSAGDLYFKDAKAKGYPHQFRLALDADTVVAYHSGLNQGYSNYDATPYDTYYVDGSEYTSYNQLGEIDVTKTISNPGTAQVCLKYKSYDALLSEFGRIKFSTTSSSTGSSYIFDPLYTLENTYYDPGQLNAGTWVWQWNREPYAVATNLIVLAEIILHDNADAGSSGQGADSDNNGPEVLSRADDGALLDDAGNEIRTVYLGQNNIFYLRKENLLMSKLEILNTVMLSGGNAGIQILHGQWDRHLRWDDDDENRYKDTHLDKVAWNDGSKLWFGKVKWQQGTDNVAEMEDKDDKGNPLKDINGNPTKRVKLEETVFLETNASVLNYLDLIPAEISGGDGQGLIAPHAAYMGKDWRYYLAPEAEGSSEGNRIMDRDNAVEISYNHLVALIHKIIGPVDIFRNGRMYFSVPIPHRISAFNHTTNTNAWRTFGAFSLVRNNWYNIKVTEITRLGTPVDVPSQPIIPVMDVKRSYINLGVKLLNWHDIIEDNIPMM